MRKYIILFFTAFSCFEVNAYNCLNIGSALENTVCNNNYLRWLDRTLSMAYIKAVQHEDIKDVNKKYTYWSRELEKCTSDECIERAYYAGIGILSDTNRDFDWGGEYWNMLAPNLGGGVMKLSKNTQWNVTLNIRTWSGFNKDEFTAEARKLRGMLLVDRGLEDSDCKLLLIPKKDNSLVVYSNFDWGCRISMPEGVSFDGVYKKSNIDPRPQATLLSLGIFPNREMEDKFRGLVGDDYKDFVSTANMYSYQRDIDNIGASVLSMWVQGAANSKAAMIMYTPKGDIWAGRIFPSTGGRLKFVYYSSDEVSSNNMPKTLSEWKLNFFDE